MELRQQIPRATLMGLRTLMNGRGHSQVDRESQNMQTVDHEDFEDNWPLSAASEAPQSIGH